MDGLSKWAEGPLPLLGSQAQLGVPPVPHKPLVRCCSRDAKCFQLARKWTSGNLGTLLVSLHLYDGDMHRGPRRVFLACPDPCSVSRRILLEKCDMQSIESTSDYTLVSIDRLFEETLLRIGLRGFVSLWVSVVS